MAQPASPAVTVRLANAGATTALGSALGRAIGEHSECVRAAGLQIGLAGDLGAGKTSLVRAMLRELNVSGPIKSPTYAVLEPYTLSSLDFYHFDFYRFDDPKEFGTSGFRELFGPGRVCAIEWPEKAGASLPTADLAIALTIDGDGRIASIVAATELGQACLTSAMIDYRADTDGS